MDDHSRYGGHRAEAEAGGAGGGAGSVENTSTEDKNNLFVCWRNGVRCAGDAAAPSSAEQGAPLKLGSQMTVMVQPPPPQTPSPPPPPPPPPGVPPQVEVSTPAVAADGAVGPPALAPATTPAVAAGGAVDPPALAPATTPVVAADGAVGPPALAADDSSVTRAWLASACSDDQKAQMATKSKIQIVGLPPVTNQTAVNATAMAAVTLLTPYEMFHFELWKRYYGEAFGYDNLYVILHYNAEDPGALWRLNLTGITVAGFVCDFTFGLASELQRDATHTLLRMGYTYVVNGDVDEFLVPNKDKYPGGLREFTLKDEGLRERDYVRQHGFSMQQQSEESAYDPALALFAQRTKWWRDDPYYCKVMLVRQSERSPPDAFSWAVGQHELSKAGFDKIESLDTCGGNTTTDMEDARLVHMKCYDKNILHGVYDGLKVWKPGAGSESNFDAGFKSATCHHEANEAEFLKPIDKRFTFGDDWSFEGVPVFMTNHTLYPGTSGRVVHSPRSFVHL